jgi:CRISPR system Cascade subunit CasB
LNGGKRASLKRNAGRSLCHADARALSAFYAIISGKTAFWREELTFGVSCMACLWKPEDRKEPQSFAKCLLQIASSSQTNGLDGRMIELLDTSWMEAELLNVKLFRLVRRIKTEGLSPDFDALREDLMHWDHGNRYIQLRWAREYFGGGSGAEEGNTLADDSVSEEGNDEESEEENDAV